MTAPDLTTYTERYGTSGWQRGLSLASEVSSEGVRQKWTTVEYRQDDMSASFPTNPRVIETNVYDVANNRRRVTLDYSAPVYAQYGLPYFVSEYAANGSTELRRSYTDYNLSQSYLDRRIIGLVSVQHVLDTVTGQWKAKTSYGYDDPVRLNDQATNARGHDPSYNASFTIRGNVTSVSRWDATDPGNANKALTSYVGYDAAGNVLSATDPAGHTDWIGYGDSFSDGNNSRGTFAYPTNALDADNNWSYAQYNFDFGAKTRVHGPPPLNQPNGIIQTFAYDEAARLQRVTTANTGAYIRYVYQPTYTQSFSTVNHIDDDAYSVQVFDGLGQVFEAASYHPGSSGGYSAVTFIYDKMGRVVKRSNPTEINGNWQPTGDDNAGWVSTTRTGHTRIASSANIQQSAAVVVIITDRRTPGIRNAGQLAGVIVIVTQRIRTHWQSSRLRDHPGQRIIVRELSKPPMARTHRPLGSQLSFVSTKKSNGERQL